MCFALIRIVMLSKKQGVYFFLLLQVQQQIQNGDTNQISFYLLKIRILYQNLSSIRFARMNSNRNMDRTKQKFDLDSQVSQDQEVQSPDKKQGRKSQSLQESLYLQNMEKYIKYLSEFAKTAEDAEAKAFNDGSTYVNCPLIDITQINFEKNIGLFDIINVEDEKNKNNFVKTLTVFTYLDNEVNKVIDILQLNWYNTLLMYGDQSPSKAEQQLPETMTARIFPAYRKIFDLVRKLMSYIQNLVVQLHSIINRKQPNFKSFFKGINFDYVINILGRALRAVYVIDAIVMNNPNIQQHWEAYKKLIKLARKEPEKFNSTSYKLKKVEKIMGKFEGTILSKRCMEVVMEVNFDQVVQQNKIPVSNIKGNKDLREYLQLYLQRTLDSIQKNLGEVNSSADEEKRLLDLMCIYSLYRKLFPSQDFRDFWKRLWTFQKKIPIVEAHSFVCVYISTFMNSLCPISKKPSSMDPKDENAFLELYIKKLGEKVGIDFVSNYRKFCVWLSRMQSILTSNSSLKDLKDSKIKLLQQRLSNRIHMICQGINIIYQLNKLIYLCFMLHINERVPLTMQLIGYLILGLESLKATAYMISKKSQAFDTTILTKTVARDMHILIQPFYNNIKKQCESSDKKYKQLYQKRDALKMMLTILKTPTSELKISIIKYCLNFVDNKQIIKEEQFNQIQSLLNKLQILAYHHMLVQKYQRCDYLYCCKDILPAIFQWKRENPNTCKRLQFLFDSFEDSAEMLKKCEHLANNQQIFEDYRKFIITCFEQNYMLPLKRKVEDFLRLSTHCMLIQKLQGLNPYKQQMADLVKMVQFQKISVFDTRIDIKVQISKSFNQTFYNMNTINTYDMQTYEQMRIMANYLFGLHLHDVYLPNQTISQGKFDIFTIIRNIPKFISSYNYNLLSQKFLQVTSEEKMISSVGIQQISDSIRTHGLGILSTTVNAFYKFQKQQIQNFNKFMFNDVIRSLLQREKKWFRNWIEKQRQAKNDGNQSHYPYDRARGLYKEIKNLQKYEDQSNMLDHLRIIITSIGNALGFVRLLRSASLNYSSKSVQFLPLKVDLQQSFQEICIKANLSETSKTSCKQLDDILKKLEDNFSGKIDYLNLMVKMFAKLSNKQNKHLNNFFILIPALSINYIEHIGRGKQKINRKISAKAFMYDDGFLLGIAYLLCLLKQNPHYKTLHWDSSTSIYLQSAKTYSKEMTNDSPSRSAKFKQDINTQNQLLLKKLQIMQLQFKFYHYGLVSSNVLFTVSQIQSANVPTSPPTLNSTMSNGGQQTPVS